MLLLLQPEFPDPEPEDRVTPTRITRSVGPQVMTGDPSQNNPIEPDNSSESDFLQGTNGAHFKCDTSGRPSQTSYPHTRLPIARIKPMMGLSPNITEGKVGSLSDIPMFGCEAARSTAQSAGLNLNITKSKMGRLSDIPMFRCEAARSAAQSPLNWQELDEPDSVEDTPEQDSENEANDAGNTA